MAERALSTAVVRFAEILRHRGLPVTLIQASDAVRALDWLDLSDREEIFIGLRSILVGRIEDYPTYERCFDAFWRFGAEPESGIPGLLAVPPSETADSSAVKSPEQKRETLALEGWGEEEETESGEPLSVPGVSDREALAGQDFSTFNADQFDE